LTSNEYRKLYFRHHRTRERQWSAFRKVMEAYYAAVANAGSSGAIDYEQALSGSTGSGYVVGRVEISDSDLVCDVETAAKRVLGPRHLSLFRKRYIGAGGMPEEQLSTEGKVLDIEIQDALGRAFLSRGIYPIKKYKRSVRQLGKG